jgi:hypothetical protein
MDCPDGLWNLVAAGSPTSIAVYGKTEASLALSCEALNTARIPLDGMCGSVCDRAWRVLTRSRQSRPVLPPLKNWQVRSFVGMAWMLP